MRWYLGAVVILGVALLWWCSSRSAENDRTPMSEKDRAAAEERRRPDPVSRASSPSMRRAPAVDATTSIRIDTAPRADDGPPEYEISRQRRMEKRQLFADRFERFCREAEVTDAQRRAVLLALYDFQELHRRAEAAVRRSMVDPRYYDELDHAQAASSQAFREGSRLAGEALRAILTEDQYWAWQDIVVPIMPMVILAYDRPIVIDRMTR